MPRRRLATTGLAVAAIAMLGVGAMWLADQSAFVMTSDARVRARMVTIASEISGRIADMHAEAGGRVARGDPLVRLDDTHTRLALAAAALDLKALEARVARERLNAEITRDRGEQRLAARQSALAAATADVGAAQALLARVEADHRRTAALHGSGLVSQAGMDRAEADLEVARQAMARADAQLADSRAGIGEARADARTAELAAQDADALALSAHALMQRIALLKAELSRHVVTSPIDGVVDEVFAEAGEHVSPGARLALAHAPVAMWLEANIKETDLPRIRIGADVEIRLDASRTACSGAVEHVGDAATAEFALIPNANPAGVFTKITQRVPVRIGLGADCRGARPGAMATLRIRAS